MKKSSKRFSEKEQKKERKSSVVSARSPLKKTPELFVIGEENIEVTRQEQSVVDIGDLPLKYVLKCVSGIYKGRFVFITTHSDGEVIGSGDAKKEGLTLQIEGVGLSSRHASLKFDGFKSFQVTDFGSQRGTWMNIPPQGSELLLNNTYFVGKHTLSVVQGNPINEIEEACLEVGQLELADILNHNGITSIALLLEALPSGFKEFPFNAKQRQQAIKIGDSISWFKTAPIANRTRIEFTSEPFRGIIHELGFQPLNIYKGDPKCQMGQCGADEVVSTIQFEKGVYRIVSRGADMYEKIRPNHPVKLKLYDHITIGDLGFQLTRFNFGLVEDLGGRKEMEDAARVSQDLGVSKHQLVSLFWVADGHGGSQCVNYLKANFQNVLKENLRMIDNVKVLNEGVRILVQKCFFQLDYGFYKAFPELSLVSGATLLALLVIGCRCFVINLGDCKALLGRTTRPIVLAIQHKPSRPDQKNRIDGLGGFLQYERLLGKMTVSRCLGSFEYKSLEDYEMELKGGAKSFISCLPDIKAFDIDPESDEYILLSTDGFLEGSSYQELNSTIKAKFAGLQTQQTPEKILKAVVEKVKQGTGQPDNMAAILIILRKGQGPGLS